MQKQVLAVRNWGIKNAPTLLIAGGITGMIVSVGMAVKATPKAIKLLEEHPEVEVDWVEELPKKEIVKTTIKCYIPALVTMGLSVMCIVSANRIHVKRNLALVAVAKVAEKAYLDYQDEVKSIFGVDGHKKVKTAVADKRLNETKLPSEAPSTIGYGDVLCYDELSGQPFYSNKEKIAEGFQDFNDQLRNEDYASVNDLYYCIGVPQNTLGEYMGWHVEDGHIRPEFNARVAPDGRPALVVQFSSDPVVDYQKRR